MAAGPAVASLELVEGAADKASTDHATDHQATQHQAAPTQVRHRPSAFLDRQPWLPAGAASNKSYRSPQVSFDGSHLGARKSWGIFQPRRQLVSDLRDRFGKRYEVSDSIGQGGMGQVFLAWDSVREQKVAIKVLSERHATSRAVHLKFENEYRSMLRFNHPNCLRVYELGLTDDHLPFLVMEYVDGRDLSKVERPTVTQAADILAQICQALAYIHSRLYVHRDLKPDNIKVLANGGLKLLDYGLMSQLGVSSSSSIAGTLHYLAPEAITGGIVDASTDLYSLGIIAYELLTGRRPFGGKRADILRAHLDDTAAPPSSLRADLPPSLDKIIAKLLAKKKCLRYRNAAEVLEDLTHLVSRPITESTAQQQGYLFSSDLVGRETDVALFNEHLQSLLSGQSGAVFFGAPAGIGKTRLLSELKALGELSGVPTIWVDDASADRVYGWLEELLRQLALVSTEKEVTLYGSKLGVIAKWLQKAGANHKLEEALDDAAIARAVVGWLGSVTARIPLLLLVDNIQWMDLKSLAVLNDVLRAARPASESSDSRARPAFEAGDSLRLLVVGTFRSDEIEKTSPLFHTQDERISRFYNLEPLTRQQSSELLDILLHPTTPSAEFRSLAFELSGGNVFDLIELLRYLIVEGQLRRSGESWLEPVSMQIEVPEDVTRRLQARYQKLGDDARALAEAASVMDARLELDTWQALASLSEERFFDALLELVQTQIIVKENDQYYFAHAKLKDAMVEALSAARKRTLHAQLAEKMASQLEEQPDLLRKVARSFVLSEQPSAAIEHSLAAARQTEAAGAEWYAFDHYRDAARLLEQNPDYPKQAELLHEIHDRVAQFASAAWTDATTCLRWIQAAIDHHAAAGESETAFGLSLAYIVNSAISGNYDAARTKANQLLESGNLEPNSIPWAVLEGAGVCLVDWYQGYQRDCFEHAEQAIAVFEANIDSLDATTWPAFSWATFWRQKALAYLGLPLDMSEIELNQRRISRGCCDETIFWHTLTAVGARAAYSGRWRDLQLWRERASRLSRKMGKIYWFECWISHSYLYGAIQHGAFEQLEKRIEQVEASYDPYQVRLAALFAGLLALERGDAHTAKQKLETFMQRQKEMPDNSLLEGYLHLARANLALGERQAAQQLADQGLELCSAGKRENPLYRQQFLRLQAELTLASDALDDSELDQVEGTLRQALALSENACNPLQSALTHDVLAQFFLRRQQTQKAVTHWRIALSLCNLLANSYRAGKISERLDSLSLAEREPTELADSEQLASALPTEFEEVEAQTLAEMELYDITPQNQPNEAAETDDATISTVTDLDGAKSPATR
jgi:predicted Ser/Thr protein kinase